MKTKLKPAPLITKPLTRAQVKDLQDEEGCIIVRIPVALDEIIDAGGVEGFNDLANERITNGYLSDIDYKIVGSRGDNAIVEVCAVVDL